MKLSGSEIIVKSLLDIGVTTVFGYPGGQIMPLYDALYDSPLKHILTVHEQGAAHAADGYARTTGRAGVCIATSGPGATNLVTGLATAYMDSVPVVAITGQVPTTLLGRDSFQEVDITGITMPVTKHSFLIREIKDLAPAIYEAFKIALHGRPGPVLIDVPRDILQAQTDWSPPAPAKPQPCILPANTLQAIEAAVAALTAAKRPAILIGGGIISSQTQKELLALLQLLPVPLLSTLMGLGAIPHGHPAMLGLTGMHGHKAANYTISDADLLLSIGTRFSDRVTSHPQQYTKNKTLIQFDIDAAEMGKNIATNITVTGDLRQTLPAFMDNLQGLCLNSYTEWWKKIAAWQQNSTALITPAAALTGPGVMRLLSRELAAQPKIWVTDVGQHQMWAAQHLQIDEPRSWVTSGGLGTMGFGLPAALGAQAAHPDKRVVLIAGDGGFKMTGLELHTAVNEQLPLIVIIINNNCLGMVRQWQQLFYQERYASSLLPQFDFVGFSKACGAQAYAASSATELQQALNQALQVNQPTVIVANIAQQELVEPMVKPGEPVNSFIDLK